MKTKQTTRRVTATLMIVAAPLIYKMGKDIFKMGVKDGKATAAMQTRK